MYQIEIILGLLVAVAVLATLATRLAVPYPILLVLGGSALGFVPGLPPVELDPELVFLLFLPPLLYVSALFTSWRDFRANVRPITLLAVGLVLMTTFVVAAVVHTVIGLPWGAAFVLGAIVSPTDAIAATTVAQRLGVPRRIVTILEGESLVNDATGIVAYRVAVAAVVTGAFSIWEAGLQFVIGAAGGIAAGFAVGWLVVWARRHLSEDPSVQNIVSLLTPFVAYLAAEELPHSFWEMLHELYGVPGDLHFSGVLAVVTTGLYLGRKGPYIISSGTRLQGYATWELITFLMNGLIFILIGLQLRSVVEGLDDYTAGQLVSYALLTSLTVILVRMVWVFPATYVPRWASRRIRERDPSPPWRSVSVIAWTGMRGVISLAAALALPLQMASGVQFPDRDLIIFLTFCVILATLVVQGLSLPVLIRALGLEDDRIGDKEETHGRISIAEAALERLDELVDEDWVREDTAERIRSVYSYRRNRFASRFDGDPEGVEVRSAAYQRLMAELLGAQRLRLIMMRDEGNIGDEVMHRIERDLDLEESRMEL
ncbi:MAG TPA: cation:proton antiporter [Rubrobacter sp.]|nr:cation:proton antiporter [Rubrobacter sp.]